MKSHIRVPVKISSVSKLWSPCMLSVGNDELISILSVARQRDWEISLTGRWSPPCKLPASGRSQKGVMLWFTVLWFYFLSFKQRMVHSLQGPYIHHMWSPRWEGLGHPQISGKLVCVWVQNLAFPPTRRHRHLNENMHVFGRLHDHHEILSQ